MKNVLQIIENQYGSRKKTKFKTRTVRTVRYDIETTSFAAPRFLSFIPREYKEFISVNEFQAKNKCPCPWKNHKDSIYEIGYTWD